MIGHALNAMSSERLLWAGGLIRRQEPRARQHVSSLGRWFSGHHDSSSQRPVRARGQEGPLSCWPQKGGRIFPDPTTPSSHLPLCAAAPASSPSSQPHPGPPPLGFYLSSHQPEEEHRGACSRASHSKSLAHSVLLQGYSPLRPSLLSPAPLPSHPPAPAITEPLTSTQTIIPLPRSSVAPRPFLPPPPPP